MQEPAEPSLSGGQNRGGGRLKIDDMRVCILCEEKRRTGKTWNLFWPVGTSLAGAQNRKGGIIDRQTCSLLAGVPYSGYLCSRSTEQTSRKVANHKTATYSIEKSASKTSLTRIKAPRVFLKTTLLGAQNREGGETTGIIILTNR